MRVGLYLGTAEDPTKNIEPVLYAWSRFVKDEIDLEGFGSADLPESVSGSIRKIPTTLKHATNPFSKVYTSYKDTIEYIKKRKPDLLIQIWKYHTHGPGVTLAGRQTTTPVITRITGDTYNEYKQFRGLQKIGAFTLSNLFGRIPPHFSDKMIAMGPYTRDQVLKRGMNKKDIILLPPPKPPKSSFTSDVDNLYYKKKLGLPLDSQIVLYVGRMTNNKGMQFYSKVIERIGDKNNIQFLMVGNGPYREKFQSEYDSVIAPGYVSHDKIDEYYKCSDMFAHPSSYEGLPLVILEALSCNLPTVARPIGDIPFVLHEKDLVSSPSEMGDWLLSAPKRPLWKNQQYFNQEYQHKSLNNLLENFIY